MQLRVLCKDSSECVILIHMTQLRQSFFSEHGKAVFFLLLLIFVSVLISCPEEPEIPPEPVDKVRPGPVRELTVYYHAEDKKLIVKWIDPADEDLEKLRVKITWKDDNSGPSIFAEVAPGDQRFETVNVEESDLPCTVYVESVDEADNWSYAQTETFRTASDWRKVPGLTVLPKGTDGTGGRDATYVLFGKFPQSEKLDSVRTNPDPLAAGEYAGYYLGSDSNYYEKVSGVIYDSEVNLSVTKGGVAKDHVYYCKVEPIKWRVIDDEAGLLISENILAANVVFYGGQDRDYESYRPDGTEKDSLNPIRIYQNNYQYSRIRAYLNGYPNFYLDNHPEWKGKYDTGEYEWKTENNGFLQKAFTAEEQSHIAETLVDNSKNSTTDTSGKVIASESYYCSNTKDKVFLLSEYEATSLSLGFGSYNQTSTPSARMKKATDYALILGARQDSSYGKCGEWFLRSPISNYPYKVRVIGANGLAENEVFVNEKRVGIVPSITLR